MNLNLQLRILIASEVITGVASAVLTNSSYDQLPQPVGWHAALVFARVPLLLGAIAGWVGLWRLWRPARTIYIFSWLSCLPLNIFDVPYVITGVSGVLVDISRLSAGAILGIVYFSDLRYAFERKVA